MGSNHESSLSVVRLRPFGTQAPSRWVSQLGSPPPPTHYPIVYAEQVHMAKETKTMTNLYVQISSSY